MFLRFSRAPTNSKYGRGGADAPKETVPLSDPDRPCVSKGAKLATRTRDRGTLNVPANSSRIASVWVKIRVASRSTYGARVRTRSEPGGRSAPAFQGDRSWKLITEGMSGRYGTEKSVPWKTSTPSR